jgi:hypothetical protein
VRIPIKRGQSGGDDVEVASGLKGDDHVVQSQTASLQEGQSIEVAQPGEP